MADHPEEAKQTAKERKEHERWEAESDLRTLTQAREIRGDSKRMTRARKMAREQINELGKVESDGE